MNYEPRVSFHYSQEGQVKASPALPRISSGVQRSCCSAVRPSTGFPSGLCCPYQPPHPGNQDWRYCSIPLPPLGSGSPGDSPGEYNWGSRKLCVNQKWAHMSTRRQKQEVIHRCLFSVCPQRHSEPNGSEHIFSQRISYLCQFFLFVKSFMNQFTQNLQFLKALFLFNPTHFLLFGWKQTNRTGIIAPEKRDTFTNQSSTVKKPNWPPTFPNI